ncbi:hypothetical protein FB45DRAFT_223376 [Roridomyces roridus]|uniref:Secreted protein n=1 Tax=Roridomyces roridus TaxID=1738132 RepID=A0AAD7BCV4_9AGAR|nr:hypothetical protein FB45DRAFT_223376 [Roridomyces roridus]
MYMPRANVWLGALLCHRAAGAGAHCLILLKYVCSVDDPKCHSRKQLGVFLVTPADVSLTTPALKQWVRLPQEQYDGPGPDSFSFFFAWPRV